MSKTIKSLLVVLIGVLFATTAYAQSTTATIAGRVTDANGSLQDAMITAVYTPTGITYHAYSNRDGSYHINSVVAGGPYTIKVEMMGHQPYIVTNVHAPLSGTIVVNCILIGGIAVGGIGLKVMKKKRERGDYEPKKNRADRKTSIQMMVYAPREGLDDDERLPMFYEKLYMRFEEFFGKENVIYNS